MKCKQNLHTHSAYCDGENSIKELIETAIEKGFNSIGFSSHAHFEYGMDYALTKSGTEEYVREINLMKKEYKDKIHIFCGIEQDMFCTGDTSPFDYVIGSVHNFKFEDGYIEFDESSDFVKKLIEQRFSGDGMKYAKSYFENVARLPDFGKFDIIGHFDLISKHCEKTDYFDVNSKEYLNRAFEAVHALKGRIPFFEVNTGAIARGYRTTPYPSIPILKELKKAGFGAVITSDCHSKNMLDCYFDESAKLLKECGFDCKFVLTDKGFIQAEL